MFWEFELPGCADVSCRAPDDSQYCGEFIGDWLGDVINMLRKRVQYQSGCREGDCIGKYSQGGINISTMVLREATPHQKRDTQSRKIELSDRCPAPQAARILDFICVVYLDGFLVYNNTEAEHITHVRAILVKLKQGAISAKLKIRISCHQYRLSQLRRVCPRSIYGPQKC